MTLIFVCTTLSIFYLNVPSTNGSGGTYGDDESVVNVRFRNAWTFMGGIADLCITCQLYVILEEKESEQIFMHSGKLYPVLDVINTEEDVSIN